MDGFLKVSTSATLAIGPFIDDADGKTAEIALTLSQADIRLSKNGGAFAQKNDATSATHMENGYYSCPINTTDTNTVGILKVAVAESGALPVWHTYAILPAVVYDSIVGGTDTLQVDAIQWLGTAIATPDTNGYPKVTNKSGTGTGELNIASGVVDSNAVNWKGSALATVDSAGYPKVTIKSGTGAGELSITSGIVGASLSATVIDSIWDEIMEGSYTARHYMKGYASVLFSKSSGGGTTSPVFRDAPDTKNRVSATTDTNGNRTAVTLDLT